ncbi:hypothetical protein V6N13_049778 [Hibiscus sabdariffa]|uniref:Uncharacterized protein n=1 Tax=Hibiscus sabdariffa TaxID=183260 RepID=A0ABR2QW93_9ROSI
MDTRGREQAKPHINQARHHCPLLSSQVRQLRLRRQEPVRARRRETPWSLRLRRATSALWWRRRFRQRTAASAELTAAAQPAHVAIKLTYYGTMMLPVMGMLGPKNNEIWAE